MDKNSRRQYILLGAAAFVVVIVIVYLRIAAYYKIPLGSFGIPKKTTQVSSTSGVKPTSIEPYTSRGATSYIVRGAFVTTPVFEQQKIGSTAVKVLRSDFVIDEDPGNHIIPVFMDKTMYLGRFPGSLQGAAVWKVESREIIRRTIKMNAPAELRLVPNSVAPSAYDQSVDETIKNIMAGKWIVPDNLVLHPFMVGVVQ
jgi:hypothetical protein